MRVRAVTNDKLRNLVQEDWIDRTRRPYVEGDTVWVPVRDDKPCDREIPERHRYTGIGFFMVGEIAVTHGRRPSEKDVEEIVRFRKPRGVIWIRRLHDLIRTPDAEILWGTVGVVLHRESGYTYLLDPTKVMFSQGNRSEKIRMAGLVQQSARPHRVADMFAGIGYFTIPIAGSGACVHAMEINPAAFGYLKTNVGLNNLSDMVDVQCGDCRNLLSGIYERIIMGHFDAVKYLRYALQHVKAGSVIHVHSVGNTEKRIRASATEAGFSANVHTHKVKKYRPHAWHIVHDVVLS